MKYGSGSSSSSEDEDESQKQQKKEDAEENNLHLKPGGSGVMAKKLELVVHSAPAVQPNASLDTRRHLDPTTKEVKYNPKYEELYAPVIGPVNPYKTQQEASVRNTVTGFVEPAHVNDFQFDLQRKTFHSYGESFKALLTFWPGWPY